MKNVKRLAIMSPVFPLPVLRKVKGGLVPDQPVKGEEGWDNKPVFKFKNLAAGDLSRATPVVVFTSHEGRNKYSVTERHVVRLNPITHFTAPDGLPLFVCLPPHQSALWSEISEQMAEKIEILIDTPSWRVILIPVAVVRRVLGG